MILNCISLAAMSRFIRVCDLGAMPYREALSLQERALEARSAGRAPDMLLLVEHEPVYTLGRNAAGNDFLVPEQELARRGIDVVRTGRGGQVTYHGPGQLVAYPIIHLGEAGLGIKDYVSKLEQAVIDMLAKIGIESETNREHRGVWIGNNKIAAIGVRISRQVSMHGLAINVNPNMLDFKNIIPCGIRDRGVTSLAELGRNLSMDSAKKLFIESFCKIMNYDTVHTVKQSDLLP